MWGAVRPAPPLAGTLMLAGCTADTATKGSLLSIGSGMLGSFKLKLVAYFIVLAVLPLAAAFWGFGAVMTHLEERRVDGRLGAELRATVAAYERELARSAATARRLAQRQVVQEALAGGKVASIAALGGSNIRFGPASAPRALVRKRIAAIRAVRVRRGRQVLGSVVAVLPFDRLLARKLRAGGGLTGPDRIVFLWNRRRALGSRVVIRPVAPGRAVNEFFGRSRYRVLATGPLPEQPRAQLAVLAPEPAAAAEIASTREQLLLVLLGGLVLIAAIATAEGRSIVRRVGELARAATAIGSGMLDRRVPVRGRDEFAGLARAFNSMGDQLRDRLEELEQQRTRLRDSFKRFGEMLAATHDLEQLLPVITDAAAEAANASGAILTTDAGRVLEIGEVDGEGEWLEVPIATGASNFGTIVLVGAAFAEDDLVAARSLAAQAAIAIENVRLHEAVEQQALADGLTGLANRRRCEDVLDTEVARSERYGSALSVILCDLDDFKATNDSLGHAVGDRILQEFARLLREAVRDVDLAGRWGGEEFLVVLPGTDLAGALDAAERIRTTFAELEIVGPEAQPLSFTASFGAAAFERGWRRAELVASADRGLYAAKHAGKNCVEAGKEVDAASTEV